MNRLKAIFRDSQGLHARIDTYLRHSSVLRIGLVPQHNRNRLRGLLNALIDDPVQSTPWSIAVDKRPLAKDVLVVQSPSFEYVETQNSLVVYPVPFPGKAVEYLEVNSALDSWDHLKKCHLHLLLTDRPSQEIVPTGFPSLIVHDSTTSRSLLESGPAQTGKSAAAAAAAGAAGNARAEPNRVEYEGEIVAVDSAQALEANALLQASPKAATQYIELRKRSGIDQLKELLLDQRKVYEALRTSIAQSCESQISAAKAELLPSNSHSAQDAAKWRAEWTKEAHRELQGSLLPALREGLYKELAFYKLFARTDDVESVLSRIIEQGMPQTTSGLQYLKGKINAHGNTTFSTSNSLYQKVEPATLNLQHTALKTVLSSLIGIQLPLVALSLSGVLFGGFSWYSMSALGLLGVVSGFRKIQTDWLRATTNYEHLVRDATVAAIEEAEESLWKAGEESSSEKQEKIKEMEHALKEATREEITTNNTVQASSPASV